MTGEPLRILLPYDGSANAERALQFALALAQAAPGSRLELVNVQIPVGGAVAAFQASPAPPPPPPLPPRLDRKAEGCHPSAEPTEL